MTARTPSRSAPEVLYNGIRLPGDWPPQALSPESREPPRVPYLDSPPAVIPIDVGRQLFVDDFLIDSTTLRRTFHQATKYDRNPVLKPETRAESGLDNQDEGMRAAAGACPYDGAVVYDPADRLFKLWYLCGHRYAMGLAYSRDGLDWERPSLDVVDGTNVVFPYDPDRSPDTLSPWLDHEAVSAGERFKAFLYTKSRRFGDGGWLYTSPDGVHWEQLAPTYRPIGDNTSLFYNPFRRRWGLSIRKSVEGRGRARRYCEVADFRALAEVGAHDSVFWAGADRLDAPLDGVEPDIPGVTDLYGLAPVAYESIMLGAFTIHYGPHSSVCEAGRFPKLTQVKLGYSRDGFHWHRPDRSVFLGATRREGDWDRAYVRAAGGVCLVVGDRLHFYYCGFSGVSPGGERHHFAGGSTHVAFVRRDGFASMGAGREPGSLTTRPVTFTGSSLFVNIDAPDGELRAEALDTGGQVVPPFSAENCRPIAADATKALVRWEGAEDLSVLRGRPTRFRFRLVNGQLYAFWVSPDERGHSNGYVASGGPAFSGPRDT